MKNLIGALLPRTTESALPDRRQKIEDGRSKRGTAAKRPRDEKIQPEKMREEILKSEMLNSLMKKSSGSTPLAQIATSPAHSRASVVEICAAPERILRNLTILRAGNKQLFGWLAGFALVFVCAGNVRANTAAT